MFNQFSLRYVRSTLTLSQYKYVLQHGLINSNACSVVEIPTNFYIVLLFSLVLVRYVILTHQKNL